MTYEIVLFMARANNDGSYPLNVRLTEDRKPKYRQFTINNTPIDLQKNFWDKKNRRVKVSHPNHTYINAGITETKNKIQQFLLTTPMATAEDVFAFISGKDTSDFLIFFQDHIDKIKNDFTRSNYEQALSKVKKFTGDKKLTFSAITVKWLTDYAEFLAKDMEGSSIGEYISRVRTIYNKKVPKSSERNVFMYYAIPRGKSKKRASLEKDDVAKLLSCPCKPGSRLYHSLNGFAIALNAHGMRISDLLHLKHEHLSQGRMEYYTQKSGHTKLKSVKIAGALEEKLRLYGYPDKKTGYVLPWLKDDFDKYPEAKRANKIKSIVQVINKMLKKAATEVGVSEKLSTHVARHTVANQLRRNRENTRLISNILGHSDEKTTKAYLEDFETEAMDEATDDLFKPV